MFPCSSMAIAASSALETQTKAGVQICFLRVSALQLNAQLRTATLVHLIANAACNPVKTVLQTLLQIDGPSSPTELLQLMTMDSTLALNMSTAGKLLKGYTGPQNGHSDYSQITAKL